MVASGLWVSSIYTIEIDRSNPPVYPPWVKRVLHQESESRRPSKYDLRKDVELWRHPGQTWATGGEVGGVIYQNILRQGEIHLYLGYPDLIAIPEMGVEIYRELYDDTSVYAWGSVVEGAPRISRSGREGASLSVAYLCLDKEKIVQDWEQLDQVLLPYDLALQFKH